MQTRSQRSTPEQPERGGPATAAEPRGRSSDARGSGPSGSAPVDLSVSHHDRDSDRAAAAGAGDPLSIAASPDAGTDADVLPAGTLGAVQRRLALLRSDGSLLPETAIDAQAMSGRIMLCGRLLALALVTALGLLATGSPWTLVFTGLLLIAAVPSLPRPQPQIVASLGRVAEIVITCFAADFVVRHAHPGTFAPPGTAAGAMLPYLVVPPVAAALQRRFGETLALLGLSVVGVTALGLVDGRVGDRGYLTEAIEWLLLAVVAGVTAAVVRNLLAQRRDRPQPYAEATRLLTQLRTVARQLPGATLDPGSLAEHLLDDVREVARSDRAAVMCAGGGNRLVVLAQSGATRIDWETSLDADSLISEAWA